MPTRSGVTHLGKKPTHMLHHFQVYSYRKAKKLLRGDKIELKRLAILRRPDGAAGTQGNVNVSLSFSRDQQTGGDLLV